MAREIRRKGGEDHSGSGRSQYGRLPLHEAVRFETLGLTMPPTSIGLATRDSLFGMMSKLWLTVHDEWK